MAKASTTTAADMPWSVRGELPLVFEPRSDAPEAKSIDALAQGLEKHADWVRDRLVEHGAFRFRGFDAEKPEDFERIARVVSPALGNDYMGTSPRGALTDYVFNASELPDYFPIPQHCEMSFCAEPPTHLFFYCMDEPAPDSGETPLCDFRKVWRDLDAGVRDRFIEGGIRIVRNYASPHEDADAEANPNQLKSWPEIFNTTDRAEVEAQCRAEGFTPEWSEGDALKLVSTQPVSKDHPISGETAWYNHITTFHLTTALSEYKRIAAYRPTERHQGLVQIATTLEERLRQQPGEAQAMHSTRLDGSEFPPEDLEHVRDVVWQNLVVESWKKGDILAIDNASVSHGRLPYEGDRRIVVCWS
ncbi:MAG: TauD/TfdA family dioxygenase [Myxococcota bacterium]